MSLPPDDRFGRGASQQRGHHPTNGLDAETIRTRMAEVRSDLERDAMRVSHEVQRATHWEFYVRKFPFVCAGLAAVVGYSLIPSPRRETVVATDEQIKKLADAGKLHLVADPPPKQQASVTSKALLALGTIAARAAMAYVGKELGSKAETVSNSKG